MGENEREPVFLSGGMRPGPASTPVGLPSADDVVPGSVVLDASGNRWRATGTEWVRVDIVTGREHRALVLRTRIVGAVSLAGFLVLVGTGILLIVDRGAVPVLGIAPVLLIACGFGYAWTRMRRRLAGQEVVPE
ncbi:hypothetical protein [Leifsonia aquatica]|uniref:hypothetical protein n=1 Tax=Leifsonia aquatica TaxID=144185 RepID=UPI00046AAA5E|nr:hypothetical protein [Leifsonia aquatica]